MDLDDVLGAWRSQDDAPLYNVDTERLRQGVQKEVADLKRSLVNEARFTYGMSAVMFGFMTWMVSFMVYDDDPRTWWDFVIALLGAAAFVFWGVHVYVSRRTLALRQRHLGVSLRDEIACQITLLDYQIGRTWRPGGVLLTMLPMLVGVTAALLAVWRVNNDPFDWVLHGSPILLVVVSVPYYAWSDRRKAEKETLPRKRQLEALLRDLDR